MGIRGDGLDADAGLRRFAGAMIAADGAPSYWTWSGLARSAAIAGVAIGTGAALGYLVAHEPVPQTAAPHAAAVPLPEAERALLSPLHEGDALGGFAVTEIHAVGDDGVLRILCRKGRAAVRLEVALAGEGGPPPPAIAGRYAVFYAIENADAADGERLAVALAAILQANAAVPPPPRLTPFAPRP